MTEAENAVTSKNQTLKLLYRKWPEFKRYLATLGCPSTDAEDVFQESLLIFSRKLDDPDFTLTVAPFHYVKNTCKFVWYNASRKKAKLPTQELYDVSEEEDLAWLEKEMKLRSIETAIASIGEKCQQLLKLFYGKGSSMTEIAKRLGFRNDKVAKAQKYRCIHKVKEAIDANDRNEDLSNTTLNS